MERLAIFGASGHGKVVADCAECAGWKEIIFFDDAWPGCSKNGSWDVIGNTKSLLSELSQFDGVIVAIGNNKIRLEKYQVFLLQGATLVSVIHPSTVISKTVSIGSGSVVMPGAIINVDSSIGICSIINTGVTIDHDCVLGDAVHVSPGAHLAGGVSLDKGAWVGVGASITQMICIGEHSIVAAGAVVVRDVVERCTVAGVPAKLLTSSNG